MDRFADGRRMALALIRVKTFVTTMNADFVQEKFCLVDISSGGRAKVYALGTLDSAFQNSFLTSGGAGFERQVVELQLRKRKGDSCKSKNFHNLDRPLYLTSVYLLLLLGL